MCSLSAYTAIKTTCKFCVNLATRQKQRTKGTSVELNHYQREAAEFAVPLAKNLNYLIPGLAAEAGEVAGVFAKAVRKGLDPDKAKILDELGDVLWFVALTAKQIDVTLEDVARANISKLYIRAINNTIDSVEKRNE